MIGVVHKDVISSLVTVAHAAKLRVAAVDNNAFAFQRALPDVDAVLDVGLNDSRLHIFAGRFPVSRRFATGGAAFTQAVALGFGTDDGSGEATLDLLVADVAHALVDFRADGLGDVRTIALVGNGSRLSELTSMIERAAAVRVGPGTLDPGVSRTLPPDVVRAASPDWCLAYGLALWAAP